MTFIFSKELIKLYFSYCLLILLSLFASCKHTQPEVKNRTVFIKKEEKGYTLYRNGTPFIIKGAAGTSHLHKLNEIGGNTIRTYDTLHIASILDSAQANNIAVIVSLPMVSSNDFEYFYNDTAKIADQYHAYKKTVEKYKDHPALLMWCLGNELEFPYRPSYNDFYKTLNSLLDMIHTVDPNHPVTTPLMSLQTKYIVNLQLKMPDLDVISINTFGGLSTIKKDLKSLEWIWEGPYLISEWGINGYWEEDSTAWGVPIEKNTTKKAEQYQQIYKDYMPHNDPRYLGSFVFFWGNKQERTHTWFSMFSENGASSEAVGTMQYLWTGKAPVHGAPQVKYLLVDNKGSKDNLIFPPNSIHSAELILTEYYKDSLEMKWEVLPEDWYKNNLYSEKPKPMTGLIVSQGGKKASFRTPLQEGPYRIFVEAYDKHGNFASTNTPFYIIK
jgi:hypothetical protein